MTERREPTAERGRSGALWMLSPFSVLASAPLWIMSLVFNEPAAYLGWTPFGQMVILSAAGYVVMATLLLATDRLPVLRRISKVHAGVVVGVAVIVASEARLTVVIVGSHLLGLPDGVPVMLRAVSAAFLALAAFGIAGFAHKSWALYRDERDQLLLELMKATGRVEGHEAAVAAMSSVLRETIRGRLAEARPIIARELDALKEALVSGADGRSELDRLNSITDSRWRTISAEAWRRVTPDLPRVGLREFAWAYALTRPFSLPALLLGSGALTFFVFARTMALDDAAHALALWLGLAVSVALITNALAPRSPRLAVSALVVGHSLLMSYPIVLVLAGVVSPTDTELQTRIFVINAHVVWAVMIAGASPSISRNRDAVLAALRRRRDQTSVAQLQVESRLLGVAHEVAATLHGASRSAFMADALRLEAALDRGDRRAAIELVEEVRATILEAEDTVDRPTRSWAVTDIIETVENWRSVCDITVSGSWNSIPLTLVPAAHTVVVEAIADAMRHGECGHIDISVSRTAAGVDIVVVNDGAPADLDAPSGLGTQLLDDLAPSQWHRTIDPDGCTRLSVSLTGGVTVAR